MEISKVLNEGKLIVMVKGRIDTVTSPELEKEVVLNLDGVKTLTFDFSEVEYISSAGLRVILAASKVMAKQGYMNLINVPQDIKDIFEMTGFSEVLNIE